MFRVGLKAQFSLGISVPLLSKPGLGCGGLLPVFQTLSKMSVKSSVTSVLWDEHSCSGRGADLCVRNACSVAIPSWPNILMFAKKQHVLSKSGFGICVSVFILYRTKPALLFSSASMLRPLPSPQESSVWCTAHSSGYQSHVNTTRSCHPCAAADAFSSSPTLPKEFLNCLTA